MLNYSIIIPHKNSAELLEYCLSTIPVRDDVQVIVVDDNSDPEKVDFGHFPQWKGKNYEYYLTKEGKGAGYARNVGLEHAKGKWLLFVDADDFLLPTINDIFDECVNSEADVIYFRPQAVMLEDRKTPSNRGDAVHINMRIDNYLAHNGQGVYLTWGTPWCKIIRHELVEKHGMRFDELPYSNDAYFSTSVDCNAESIKVMDNVCYVVTESSNSLTSNYLQKPRELEIRATVFVKMQELIAARGWDVDEFNLLQYMRMLWSHLRGLFFENFNRSLDLGYTRYQLGKKIFGGRRPKAVLKRWYVIIGSYFM